MKVYQVKGDFEYGWINCSEDGVPTRLDHAAHDGAEIDRTTPIQLEVSSREEGWIETDCLYFPAFGTIPLSDRTFDAAGSMLTDAGYCLDTRLDADTRYKIFICTVQIDALDQERSELTRFRDGAVWKVRRYELNADSLQHADFFRLKHRRSKLFVSDRFVSMAERHGLTGFIFEEIWSSETGGVQLQDPVLPIERFRGEFAQRAKAKRKALNQLLAERAAAAHTS